MNGTGGNWNHVYSRSTRVVARGTTDKVLGRLARRIKNKNMPNAPWYRPIYKGSTILGYVCGQGCYISTILSSTMVPKGTRI